MRIETWTSDKGNEEIHHFLDESPQTYLFGFNEKLLGTELLEIVRWLVKQEFKKINE